MTVSISFYVFLNKLKYIPLTFKYKSAKLHIWFTGGMLGMERKETDIEVKTRQIGSKPFLIIVTACISIFCTLLVVYKVNDGIIFIKDTQYGDLTEVLPVCEVMDNIEKEYYAHDAQMPERDSLILSAIDGMIASLGDPYSEYFTAQEYEEYSRGVSGSYYGLGITVAAPNETGATVTDIYEDSPAQQAGVCVGDIITAVNSSSTAGLSPDELNAALGANAETVTLTVLRGDRTLDITVKFGEVKVTTVYPEMLENKIGYIYIEQFGENTAEEFENAVQSLTQQNMSSLIVDVRNNPGGYLDSVVSLTDVILASGTIVSVGNTLEDPDLTVFSATEGGVDVPLAVLINEESASASEIFAAAIKENGAGTVIGKTTYGKGIVQSTGKLYSTDGYLKLTTDAYYTPLGNNIHKTGVSPDITVELPEELKGYITNTVPKELDTQLQRAIEFLNN